MTATFLQIALAMTLGVAATGKLSQAGRSSIRDVPIALAEVVLSIALLVPSLSRVSVLASAGFFTAVTPFGVHRVRANRDCGCFGQSAGLAGHDQSVRGLLARNTVLVVGALLAGIPHAEPISTKSTETVAFIGILAITVFAFVIGVRIAREHALAVFAPGRSVAVPLQSSAMAISNVHSLSQGTRARLSDGTDDLPVLVRIGAFDSTGHGTFLKAIHSAQQRGASMHVISMTSRGAPSAWRRRAMNSGVPATFSIAQESTTFEVVQPPHGSRDSLSPQ